MGFSIGDEDVVSHLEMELMPRASDVRRSFGGSPLNEKIFKYTCKVLGKALCKLRGTSDHSVNVFIEHPLLLVDVFELAYIFIGLYEASWSFETYYEFLSEITPFNMNAKEFLNPEVKASIMKCIETSSEQPLGGVDKELTEVMEKIFKLNEEDVRLVAERRLTEFRFSKEVPVNTGKAPPDNIDKAIERMFEQVGRKDGSGSRFTDDEEEARNQIAGLCSAVKSIFEFSMKELETVSAFLEHFAEFRPLAEQLKMCTKDEVLDYLLEEWEDSSSVLHDQSLPGLVSVGFERLKLNWTLRILKETMLQMTNLSCCDFTYAFYVEMVTGEERQMLDRMAERFAEESTLFGMLGNFSECYKVTEKTMLTTVRYHKRLKKKFVLFQQEFIKRGVTTLDMEAYDIILFLVACLRDVQLDLKRENTSLSEKIDYCRRVYKGFNVHGDLDKISMKQNESVMALLRNVAMFLRRIDSRIPTSEAIAFKSLIAEIKLKGLVKDLGTSSECTTDESQPSCLNIVP